MKNIFKWISVYTVAAVWIVGLTVSLACAQNFAGLVPTEEETSESFPDVSMTYSPEVAVSTFSTKGSDGIPDFIKEFSYYTLGKTDVIEISVSRHPEVSGQFLINNEGKIQYEFVGDVYVEGLTKSKIQELLVTRLEEYIISPDVIVQIVGYNSKIVYVIGEVGRPRQ